MQKPCVTRLVLEFTALFFLAFPPLIPDCHAVPSPVVTTLASVRDGIRTPVRLATDTSGNFYVTDPRGGGILKYDNAGNLVQTIAGVNSIFGIAIAPNGDLLASQGTSVAVIDSTSGTMRTQFGTFRGANGIAVDNAGTIYVTDSLDSCVQVFTSTYQPLVTGKASAGKPANSFGSFGKATGQFVRPTGITFEKLSNQLAIADMHSGQIQFYSTSGVYQSSLGSFGSGPLRFTSPQSIAFEYTSDGSAVSRMYVVDSFQATIQVIDGSSGAFLSYIGSYGLAEGELVTPGDVLFDRYDPLNGRLLVTNGSGRLSFFSIDMITGRCGGAHARLFTSTPTTNLCRNGSVMNFSGSGPWNWSCVGQNGGATEVCSASVLSNRVTVTIAGINGGSGSVTSNPAGITCLDGTCSAAFTAGSSVTLMPRPSAGSTFVGWSGACSSAGTGDCTLSVTADRNATATFDLVPRAKVDGKSFGTLTSAYAAINVRGTITAQAVAFVENLVINQGSFVTLMGGYDTAFGARTGHTTINGRLTISSGTLVVDRVVIK